MIGQTIAHYKVGEKLGAGGMGEVFRATDSKLNREVALKILPEQFARDKDRMARFKREAQVLASLNHPNIAAIFGLEEQDGIQALVLELVEGPTLAERIELGAIPLKEALKYAKQIAEALEAAHDQGIIHRDLKPANVKVKDDGTVKVLDFGLAKALAGDPSEEDIGNSPTLSVAATQAGIILGTAAYMPPEQAKGKKVDRRADIWSFGVVLFEMLTGQRIFTGETISEVLASVIKEEPDWDALPEDTPAPIRKLLNRCLQKEPKQRLQAIGEARIALAEYETDSAAASVMMSGPVTVEQPAWLRHLPWAVAGALAAATLVVSINLYQYASKKPQVVRSFIPAPPETGFDLEFADPGPVAISPDGTKLAFTARDKNGANLLYVRPLDSAVSLPLQGTEDAAYPFWSPDSRWIGYFDTTEGKVKKIEAGGGPPLALCDAGNGKGGAWNEDDVILFTPEANTPIHRVPAAGGAPVAVTEFDEARGENSHRFPQFLPDGKHFLFFARSTQQDEHAIKIGSLDSPESSVLLRTSAHARYASGHILFLRDGTLMAQPFSASRRELKGDAFPIAENVQTLRAAWRGIFAVSDNGILVYRSGAEQEGDELRIYSREGDVTKTLGGDVLHLNPSLSPDGKRVLVGIPDEKTGTMELWVYEIERGLRSRFTFDPAGDLAGIWSPDGRTVLLTADRNGNFDIFRKPFAGAGTEEPLLAAEGDQYVIDWSRDGRYVAYVEILASGSPNIGILPLEGDAKPYLLVESDFVDVNPRFSPDGRWLAYNSNESGRFEVYVTPFPGPGRKWQVSTAGGLEPRWGRRGRELYYVSGAQELMAVQVDGRGETFDVGAETALFDLPGAAGPNDIYDAFPDGNRFVVIMQGESQSTAPLTLVLNWTAEIENQK